MGPYFPLNPHRGSASTPLPGWAPIGFCRMEAGHGGAATTWLLRRWLWVLQGLVVCPLMLSTKRTVSRDPATSTQLRGGTAVEKGRMVPWGKAPKTPMCRQVAVLKGQAEGGEGIQSRRVLVGEA